ncbi:MAG: hypothetical protein ACYTG6_10125, partial [Planctomycetota bacterium]
ANLRSRLRGIVVRSPRRRANRTQRLPVPIDDSKVIHRRFGLEGLARGFGVFASAMETAPPADLADLLSRFSDREPREFERRPWYEPLDAAAVPRYPWTGPLGRRFERRRLAAVDLRVLPLDAGELNDAFREHGNKARVLGLATGTCLLAVLDRYPGEDAEIIFDRHGGRLDYGRYLADLFPFASVTRRPSAPGESRYEIRLPGRRLYTRFATAADRLSLAVGWASMAAKLTRELFMRRLNDFFVDHVPGLRPTAGYHTDGKRFLGEVDPYLRRAALDPRRLIRER